jgi:ATP-binding cassette subfamily B protein
MMRGPMRGHGMGRPAEKPDKRVIKRLLSYLKPFRARLIVVMACILISALTGVMNAKFLQTLIDDYITPLLGVANPVFDGLLRVVFTMAGIYLFGVAATFLFNFLMVTVAQKTLKNIRDEMFTHMQLLPIKYFDTHSFGDVMSHYTNDTDTLRQMISQSLPQTLSSLITVVTVFAAMLATNVSSRRSCWFPWC